MYKTCSTRKIVHLKYRRAVPLVYKSITWYGTIEADLIQKKKNLLLLK